MRKILSVFLFSALIMALLATAVFAAECEHNWEEISKIAATCTEEGQTIYKCSLCEKQKIETVDALSSTLTHKWGSLKTTKATCSENGQKARTCSRCKAVDVTEILPALGHTYKVTSENITCADGGTRVSTCTRCKATLNEKVKAGCDFEFVSTSATCTAAGEATYKCSRCGKYDHKEEKALGHDLVKSGGPTCTERGKYVNECTRCDYTKTDTTYSKALGHDIPETGTYSWKVTKSPTCEEEGRRRARCSRCLEYVYEDIEKTDHDYSSDYFLIKAPTFDESGKYVLICEDCDDVLTKSITKGTTNLAKYTVPTVKASEESGIVEKGTIVELDCELLSATIYYTVDGKSPATKSSRIEYDGGIEITTTTTIRAYAVYEPNDDVDPSEIITLTYFVEGEEEEVVVEMTIDSKFAYINDTESELDAVPVIRNERTMLPIRFVAEALGAAVGWDDETRTVSVISDTTIVKIVVGEKKAKVNGKEIELDSPAYIEESNSRTYLPVRFVAEALGATVGWDEATRTVSLKGMIKVK